MGENVKISSYVLNDLLRAGDVSADQVERESDGDGNPALAIRFADLRELAVACLRFGSYIPPAVRDIVNESLEVHLTDGVVKLVARGVEVDDGFDYEDADDNDDAPESEDTEDVEPKPAITEV